MRNGTIAVRALLVALLVALPGAREARGATDIIELAFGASNIQATTGNGGLTAAVSADGDVTVLSWPSPSYYDQLHYLAANGPGARALPRMGAAEGMGAFAGLVLSTDGGATLSTTWFRDAEWTRQVAFTADDTSVIRAAFTRADLGISVVQTDFVAPGADVLVRRVVVELDAASPVSNAWLLGYANLTPGLSKIPEAPLADFLLDRRNDFLAVWDGTRDAVVQFHPADTGVVDEILESLQPLDRDFGSLGALLGDVSPSDGAIDAILADLDAHYAPGVYASMSAWPLPDGFQVGEDATDTCASVDGWVDEILDLAAENPDVDAPVDPAIVELVRCNGEDPVGDVRAAEGWNFAPQDALADAADGVLSGSRLAGAQVNTALRVPLAFQAGRAEAALYVSFDRTAAGSLAALDAVRGAEPAALQALVEQRDREWLAPLALPPADLAIPELIAFSKRTLLNLRVGTDRETGAIVASVSRQPTYQLDWPRDGAFFNAALDVAGDHALVSRRNDFYAAVMRTEPIHPTAMIDQPVPGWPGCPECDDYPADSWEMNYYADGVVGGNIRLEIDNTALLIWSFVAHAGYLEEPERTVYLQRMWPAVKRGADFLAGWRDPETGLVWPANEDDHPTFTQGLQGAGTVFGALRVAARMALAVGEEESARAWAHRAGELRTAITTLYHDEEHGFVRWPLTSPEVAPVAATGMSSWLAWPARLLPWEDPRIQEQLARNMEAVIPRARGEGTGGSYLTKSSIPAALALADGPDRDLALELAERMARDIADPEARYLGEVFLNVDEDADGVADRRVNAVATPHLWAATLVYLTAMAYYAPERFDPHESVLPEVEIPAVPLPDGGGNRGCACALAPRAAGPAAGPVLLLVAFAAAFAARARRIRFRGGNGR